MAKRTPKAKGDTQPVLDQELGIINLLPASTWALWAGDTPGLSAVGKDPLAPSLDELVLMLRRDGQAHAMLNLLTLPIRAAFAKGEWISSDGDSAGTPEVEFANNMWNLPPKAGGMHISRSMFLRQSLLALPFGFSAFEIVKSYRDEGPLAGKFVIDKMGYRDPRTVTFLVDDHGDFAGFKQKAFFNGRHIDKVIEKENAWYYAANEEHNPLYGVSMFEPAFQHYQMKRKLYYIGHLAAQLAAVPGRLGEIPLGASPRQIQEFKKGLAELHFNQAMLMPPNFKVHDFGGNNNLDFVIRLVDHHNMSMAKSLLMGFLQSEDRMVLIDNGKADASADLFIQLLEAITFELSESWTNRLMPQFLDYNFGTGVYPVHRFGPLTDANKEAIFNLFNTIVGLANINCTPEFVRTTEMKLAERLGYEIDYNKIADEEEKIAKEQQAQAAQEAKMQQQQLQQQQSQQTTSQSQGPQGANRVQRGEPSPAPTMQGGRPPTVKATGKQQAAMNTIALALNDLIEPEDVPAGFKPEGENEIPEMETDD